MIPKFRAWNPHEKKMVDDKELVIWGGNIYQGDRQKIFERIVEGKKGLIGYSIGDKYLMQSTGIKDKNGTEIFEGDIIATNSFACIVSFGKYDYFEDDGIKITGIGFYLGYLNVEPATYSPFETPFLEKCEVLGNIYENELDLIMYEKWKSENPELMEGKK